MSKEETIIQTWNSKEQKYEYSLKGFDVTESINKLLLRYKEEYDKQKFNIGSVQGYLEAKEDFGKQLAELKAELDAKETINQLYKSTLSLKDSDFSDLVRENTKLKQQLKEKDEEIKKWKHEAHKACLQMEEFQQEKWDLQDKLKANTKQVCEKIRGFINKYDIIKDYQSCAGKSKFEEFLDQIEKGEDDGD